METLLSSKDTIGPILNTGAPSPHRPKPLDCLTACWREHAKNGYGPEATKVQKEEASCLLQNCTIKSKYTGKELSIWRCCMLGIWGSVINLHTHLSVAAFWLQSQHPTDPLATSQLQSHQGSQEPSLFLVLH